MKRKVIELGNKCMVMSLPIKWVKAHNIKKGAELDVEESAGNLVVEPKFIEPVPRSIELNISNQSRAVIRNEIVGAYQLGYSKISVIYRKDKEMNMIRDIVTSLLLGFDITEKEGNKILIEGVAEPSDEKHRVILRRIFLTTIESFDILIDDLTLSSSKNYKLIFDLKRKVELYHNFCQRNMTKQRFVAEKINFHSTLYQFLLAIQSDILHLYEYLEKNKPIKISKEVIEAAKKIKDIYRMTYEAFFAEDLIKTRKASDQSLTLRYNLLDKQIASADPKNAVVLHYLSEMLWITGFISRHVIVLFRL